MFAFIPLLVDPGCVTMLALLVRFLEKARRLPASDEAREPLNWREIPIALIIDVDPPAIGRQARWAAGLANLLAASSPDFNKFPVADRSRPNSSVELL